MEKRVPTKPFGRPWASWFPALHVRFCAWALRDLASHQYRQSHVRPHMALAILTMCRAAGGWSRSLCATRLEPTTNGSCGNAFFNRTTNAAGKSSRTTGVPTNAHPSQYQTKTLDASMLYFEQIRISWYDSIRESHQERARILFAWLTREDSFNPNGPFILDLHLTRRSHYKPIPTTAEYLYASTQPSLTSNTHSPSPNMIYRTYVHGWPTR